MVKTMTMTVMMTMMAMMCYDDGGDVVVVDDDGDDDGDDPALPSGPSPTREGPLLTCYITAEGHLLPARATATSRGGSRPGAEAHLTLLWLHLWSDGDPF